MSSSVLMLESLSNNRRVIDLTRLYLSCRHIAKVTSFCQQFAAARLCRRSSALALFGCSMLCRSALFTGRVYGLAMIGTGVNHEAGASGAVRSQAEPGNEAPV